MDFADISKELTDGKNLGGVAQKLYFGLWEDVQSWPVEPSGPAGSEKVFRNSKGYGENGIDELSLIFCLSGVRIRL